MQISRSTRLVCSGDCSTSATRFSATCAGAGSGQWGLWGYGLERALPQLGSRSSSSDGGTYAGRELAAAQRRTCSPVVASTARQTAL